MEYIEKGEFEQAINYWIQVREQLEYEGRADFRIGQAVIEHVTKNGAENLYPLASEFYYWGLKSSSLDYCLDEVRLEIEMLEPIADDSTYISWQALVKEEDPAILSEIKKFWVSKNPSLATPMNERLIEHWERIAYARNNYTRLNNTVYGTDDRGLIYVKYGAPDSIEEGTFTLNYGKVQNWISETIEHQQVRMEEYDPNLFTDNVISNASDFVSDALYKKNLSQRLADKLLSDFGHVEYTVWIYDRSLVGTSQNLIFFFGNLAHTQQFGLIDGPEELITQRAFRERNLGGTRFRYNFGPISQLTFYDNLKFVDDFFLDSFHEMQDYLFNNPQITSESSTEYLRNRYMDYMNSIRSSASDALSVYDRELLKFDLRYKQARFLDENNRPYEVNLIYSEPHEAIITDYNRFISFFGEDTEPEYHVQHTFSILDTGYNLVNSANDFPLVTFERLDFIDDYIKPISIFRLPVSAQDYHTRIEAKLFNITYGEKKENPSNSNQNRLPRELIGSVNVELPSVTQSEPLNTESLELSDIILCYGFESIDDTLPNEGEENINDLIFPCYVPYEMKIPTDQDLNFFFEIYNLEQDEDHVSRFTIDYETQPIEQTRGFFSRLFRGSDDTPTSITLNYEIKSDRMQDHLMVDLSDYRTGTYELTLTITDIQTGESVSRSNRFKVIDP
jgi:GWxTD domain-containing protein